MSRPPRYPTLRDNAWSRDETEDWDRLLELLSRELVLRIRMEYYSRYFSVLKSLSTPAQKLVYLYIVLFQPQTFTSIMRMLRLNERTVMKALSSLEGGGHICKDEAFWWVKSGS
jgi:DNA-binding transcriptional ArsR family regulator